MGEIIIRKVTTDDIMVLQEIGRQTFYETFAAANTPENMKKYLEEQFTVTKLTAELSNQHSAFYFALLDNKVAGYLKINLGGSQTELQDDKGLEIERIYVLQACQGQKVGQALYAKAIDVATQNKMQYVWLGVWENNKKAIGFYTKTDLWHLTNTFLSWVMMSKQIL
ncbi:GNAT family N-acetyltransferase [Niabella sp. W65]|nr:GNAT family N-acetyltransferase [Niabella sp. W65]MCH7365446.1 GNAT family N-acetyltransferase [Niabella sp. W65]